MAYIAPKDPSRSRRASKSSALLQLKQVEEYFHRLRRAGFEERIERSKFRELL